MGSILWSGRAHGVGNGNPLQYSCLECSVDTGIWQATVLWVAKSQTSKEQLSMHARTPYAGGFVGIKEERVVFHVWPMLGAEKGASANEERRMRGSGSAGSQSKLTPKRNVGGRDFPSIGQVSWCTFSCFLLFLKDISTMKSLNILKCWENSALTFLCHTYSPELLTATIALFIFSMLSFSRSVLFNSVTPWTVDCQAPLVHGILQARILEWVAISSSKDLPYPGIEPESLISPALALCFTFLFLLFLIKYIHLMRHVYVTYVHGGVYVHGGAKGVYLWAMVKQHRGVLATPCVLPNATTLPGHTVDLIQGFIPGPSLLQTLFKPHILNEALIGGQPPGWNFSFQNWK